MKRQDVQADEFVDADVLRQEQITQNIHNRQPRHLAEVLRIALRRAVHAKSLGHSSVCKKLYA